MERLSDRMSKATITATSPDESVTLTWTRSAGFAASLRADVRDLHDEKSLADEIEQVWRKVIEGITQAVEMIRAQQRGNARENPDFSNSPYAQRRQLAHDQIDEIETVAASPQDRVLVAWDGHDEVLVTIRPGTLSALSSESIAGEVNKAIAAVTRDHQKAISAVRDKVLRSIH